MKALVIGATGATGKDLVQVLINDIRYTHVTIFVRKSTGMVHHKLTEIIADFTKLDALAPSIQGDVWFSCLGTTLKAAGSKANQWQIDYEMPLKFAQLAKQNGISRTVLLSAYGASATSANFYSTMKGKLEEAMEGLGFSQYIIFRPGLLLRKDTDRMGEQAGTLVLNFFNTLGIFRKFKPMPTELLADKLAKAPAMLPLGKHIVELEKIFDF